MTKTLLFASLIAAMLLPFSGMQAVDAKESKVVDWSESQQMASTTPGDSTRTASGGSVYVYCNHEASMSNKCYGWDNGGDFYYSTPYTYKNVDSCNSYTCADLDYYHRGDSIISHNGYAYTFESSSYYTCAVDLGLCTSPLKGYNNYETIHHNNIPTGEPINHITTYKYERQGETISILVV